jgi:hypothetical protein
MSGTSAPTLHDVATRDDLDDWGPVPTMIEGLSRTSGKVLSRAPEIRPGTAAFFPEGWKGECTVRETVRKVYMIA